MTNFQQLKHEARRAEQRSDWGRAIDLYQRALDADEDMADLSLYNRIGDLHLRLTQNEAAVECYERAVDRYADNGMHTSAIALCNKILRIAPGRTSAYRRLGMLHARSGLVAEGRSNLLTFVERSLDSDAQEARAAVEEFAELTGDEEVRVRYADLLEERGDATGASTQLRVVYRERRRRGSDAESLRERLESLAPGATAEESPEPPRGSAAESGPPTVRLADLVAERVGRDGDAAFEAEPAPAATEVPPADPRLNGVRRDLERFREEVRDTLDAGDATIRYDLGVELMTIGLLDEAMEEFHAAVADPALTEAANARIGECLALRTSGAAFELRRTARSAGRPTFRLDEDPGSRPEPARDGAPAPVDPQPDAGEGAAPTASPDPSDATPDGPETAGSEQEDELQGHFFRARLAQYRIRQAEERHMTDHAAHVDLGSAYTGMGLLQEALRELGVALGGPRPVAGRAARALEQLATRGDATPELALEVLERLAAVDAGSSAERLAARLGADWGPGHPAAGRLTELAGRFSDAVRDLPALEDMFPAMNDPADGPSADAGEVDAEVAGAVAGPPDETDPADLAPDAAPPVAEEAAEGDAGPTPDAADGATDDVEEILARADALVAEGRSDAAADELRLAFSRLESERRTRQALRVFDRLLELRPDEVELHQQRAELALMVNDRAALIAAYAGLGACLRRHDLPRRARAAYGRVLDIDPGHEGAREAIAAIDAGELETERAAAAGHGTDATATDGTGDAGPVSGDEAEVEALLERLDAGSDEPGAGPRSVAEHDQDDEPGARSHYELGLAFRQMGMWDEAARELRFALNGVADRLSVLEALGECLVKSGRTGDAVRLLRDALRADEDADQLAPLYYLGLALQAEGDPAEAKEIFARVETVHPGYRDTSERLSELSL